MALLLSWLALLGPCRRHGAPSSHTSSRTRVVVATPWHPRGEARGQGGSEEPVLLFVGLLIFCPLALNFSAQWVLIFLLALQRVLILGPRVRSLDTSQSKPTCKRLGTASSAESSPDREIGSEKQCAAHHSNRSPHPGSPHTGSGKLALSRVHPQRKSSRQVAKNLALGRGQFDKLSA